MFRLLFVALCVVAAALVLPSASNADPFPPPVGEPSRYTTWGKGDKQCEPWHVPHTNCKKIRHRGLEFRGGKAHRVNVTKADLRNSSFVCSKMRNAKGGATVWKNSDFRGASIPGFKARKSNLSNTDFSPTNCNKKPNKKRALRAQPTCMPDCTSANLKGADLRSADLSGSNLTGADLSKANLTGANVSGSNLTGATLSGANLTGANVSGSILKDARLNQTVLFNANLSFSGTLSDRQLDDALFFQTKMPDTTIRSDNFIPKPNGNFKILEDTNLRGVDLSGVKLIGARISDSDLTGANLSGADLSGADLSHTSLESVDLSGANLTKANLWDTELFTVDLTNANLTGARMPNRWESAVATCTTCNTTMPNGTIDNTDC